MQFFIGSYYHSISSPCGFNHDGNICHISSTSYEHIRQQLNVVIMLHCCNYSRYHFKQIVTHNPGCNNHRVYLERFLPKSKNTYAITDFFGFLGVAETSFEHIISIIYVYMVDVLAT